MFKKCIVQPQLIDDDFAVYEEESGADMRTLKQGTPEWLRARTKFTLTVSEFGAACGFSNCKTRNALWKEKVTGVKKKDNPYAQRLMEYGKQNEYKGRLMLDKVLPMMKHLPMYMSDIWGDPTNDHMYVVDTGLWPIKGTTWAA